MNSSTRILVFFFFFVFFTMKLKFRLHACVNRNTNRAQAFAGRNRYKCSSDGSFATPRKIQKLNKSRVESINVYTLNAMSIFMQSECMGKVVVFLFRTPLVDWIPFFFLVSKQIPRYFLGSNGSSIAYVVFPLFSCLTFSIIISGWYASHSAIMNSLTQRPTVLNV